MVFFLVCFFGVGWKYSYSFIVREMSSNFRKHTFSSSRKHCLGPICSIVRSSSPPPIRRERSEVHKNDIIKKDLSKPQLRIATEGSQSSTSKHLFEKYRLNKLDPIISEYHEKKLKRLEEMVRNEQEVTQREKNQKLKRFLQNSEEMILLWKSQDVSERKQFSKKLKMASIEGNKSAKKLSPSSKQKSFLRSMAHKKTVNHPLSLLTSDPTVAKKSLIQNQSDLLFQRSHGKLKTLKTVESETYKRHLEDLLMAMEKNRKKLKKQKNKLIRSIREQKEQQQKKQREELYQYVQSEVKYERMKSRQKDDYRVFLEEASKSVTFYGKIHKTDENSEQKKEEKEKKEKKEEGQKQSYTEEDIQKQELNIKIQDLKNLISSRLKNEDDINPEEVEVDKQQEKDNSHLIQPKVFSSNYLAKDLSRPEPSMYLQIPIDHPPTPKSRPIFSPKCRKHL